MAYGFEGGAVTVPPRPKLLYLVTEDWYFCSHRLPIARAARLSGFDVAVATRVRDHGEAIRGEGFRLVPLARLSRRSLNPLRELAALFEIVRVYRRERPDIVHHVALKPVLYGSLAARIAGVPRVVNALTGMGYVFVSRDPTARLLRLVVGLLFRFVLGHGRNRLVLQNPDDARMLIGAGVVDESRVAVIRGSGVDTTRFSPAPPPSGTPVAILVSRMLWDKGVGETVAAARLLHQRGVPLRVVLVGDTDPENPAAIPAEQLRAWRDEHAVEWLGHRSDVPALLRAAHIAVLPSYREGLPKSLLEAAACGLPLVASDVPGCREIARHGENGILVPPRTEAALADALERLARDPELRAVMGRRGRELAERHFSEGAVAAETLAVYRELLG
ncbi:MAG: glycosyltransferase family 4 protein [Alphaproteobacteria bacterium]